MVHFKPRAFAPVFDNNGIYPSCVWLALNSSLSHLDRACGDPGRGRLLLVVRYLFLGVWSYHLDGAGRSWEYGAWRLVSWIGMFAMIALPYERLNPPRRPPRPNLTLGGTNFSADMVEVSSSISGSLPLNPVSLVSPPLAGSSVSIDPSACEDPGDR